LRNDLKSRQESWGGFLEVVAAVGGLRNENSAGLPPRRSEKGKGQKSLRGTVLLGRLVRPKCTPIERAQAEDTEPDRNVLGEGEKRQRVGALLREGRMAAQEKKMGGSAEGVKTGATARKSVTSGRGI